MSNKLSWISLTYYVIASIYIFDNQLRSVPFANGQAEHDADRPNIVIIMADDMGFDDVSFRGSNQFLTPHIDALAYSGIILKNMYTPAMCTPSRAALLTGKYPLTTGMQHYVIRNDEPWGLPLNETTMGEIFQKQGYFTSIFGKWHLGMSKRTNTPTMRGFDKHFGFLGAYIDYYDHYLRMADKNYSVGHDFRDNLKSTKSNAGIYATNLLADAAVGLIDKHNATEKPIFMILSHLAPHAANEDNSLQAPAPEIEKFNYIKNVDRRTYAAMVSVLDLTVGQVIDALYRKNILENTIILFYSDNGGPTIGQHANTASNYPLRGQKNSPWEGGIRSSAAIWSKKIEKLGTVWKQRFYVADILPTLVTAAGLHIDEHLKLDGVNLWSALKYGYQSVEREIVHQLDDIENLVAYTNGKWKFINGTTSEGMYDGWLGNRATESDPRFQNYEDVIRNTTVWQQLKVYNKDVQVDITKMRQDAAVTCLFTNGTLGVACEPLDSPCLFDIDIDPCEQDNLYEQHKNSKLLQEMLLRINNFRLNAESPVNLPADPLCDPAYFDGEWTWWLEQPKSIGNSTFVGLSGHIIGILTLIAALYQNFL